jgi:hypothetical protein
VDEAMRIPPRKEWLREIVARSPGTFEFRMTSQGPFSIIVMSDAGYQVLKSKKGTLKDKISLVVESAEPTYEGKVSVPAGKSWFLIENKTDTPVTFRLECFAPR